VPHFVIEYSQGLERSIDLNVLMQTVRDAAVDAQVMKLEDIKIRAISYRHYFLADGGSGFVHTTVRLLAGRTSEQKRRLSSLVRAYLARLLPGVHSISVDIVDMDPDVYLKRLL
jgi:5-carboxymethyl-2-hydroxymuconate isomerase